MTLDSDTDSRTPLLSLRNIRHRYSHHASWGLLAGSARTRPEGRHWAVDDVNLDAYAGENLGIVGESGCGKSTLARIALHLTRPVSGHVFFDGEEITSAADARLKAFREAVQIVFQDPFGALDPRWRIGRTIAEPLYTSCLSREEVEARVSAVLASVGLDASDARRFPHEFSGGQRQRIAIARAIISRPRLVIADEPVSALDVSIQAQILNLINELSDVERMSFVLISHDLSVIAQATDRVAVMFAGRIIETGLTRDVFASPQHPYTASLLEASPGRHFATEGYGRAARARARAARKTAQYSVTQRALEVPADR